MSNKVPTSFIIIIGLMLFALFFGAGNLIFPPMLGQKAGDNVWIANAGFLVTGVGLPLLAVIAFVFSGEGDLQSLASRVHPVFGIVFTIVLYLAIGPFFAIPRTGTVSFEIGIKPFLSDGLGSAALIVFTILFFIVTCFLSLNPAKLVDIVGKILTPIKLTFIGIFVVVAFIHPIGGIQAPVEVYASDAFFKGFQEGYLTLDALGAFVFGIIIVNAIREKGATTKKQLMVVCVKATIIAASLLALIYTALSYMGASSVAKLGHLDNGAEVLAKVSDYYFGSYGAIFLGVMIIVACLTTCVGLVTACSSFFHKLFPKVSYKKLAIILCVFSSIVANLGLTQLIAVSLPVLITIYPIAIILIFLTFFHSLFNGRFEVYQGSLILTFIFSLLDGLKAAGIDSEIIHNFFEHFLPLYSVGLGWLVPAIIGGVCGYVVSVLRKKNTLSSSETQLNK
ncbi:branched-chain amino acid transporter [Bacillus anthracis]|nr:branched-chain amino acid transporter [Bacillus anthracis]